MDILLKLKHLPDTDEHKIQHYDNGVFSEAKSYYASDPEDAVTTLNHIFGKFTEQGHKVSVSVPPSYRKYTNTSEGINLFGDSPGEKLDGMFDNPL